MFDINADTGFPGSVALLLQIHHIYMEKAYNKGGRSHEKTEAAAGAEARKDAKKEEVTERQGQGAFDDVERRACRCSERELKKSKLGKWQWRSVSIIIILIPAGEMDTRCQDHATSASSFSLFVYGICTYEAATRKQPNMLKIQPTWVICQRDGDHASQRHHAGDPPAGTAFCLIRCLWSWVLSYLVACSAPSAPTLREGSTKALRAPRLQKPWMLGCS
jgi:hypothetical protein